MGHSALADAMVEWACRLHLEAALVEIRAKASDPE